MKSPFVDKDNVMMYEKQFKEGYDHEYPNTNSVRIESSFFSDKRGGRILDYGFGFTREIIHFVNKGYSVWGLDTSKFMVERGIKRLEGYGISAHLSWINPRWKKLPFRDEFFDVIHASQSLYFLGSYGKMRALLFEFYRILKSGGKLYISVLGRKNSICTSGRQIANNLYKGDKNSLVPQKCYVFPGKKAIRDCFSMFNIIEIGSYDNNYCGVCGFHYAILAVKNN